MRSGWQCGGEGGVDAAGRALAGVEGTVMGRGDTDQDQAGRRAGARWWRWRKRPVFYVVAASPVVASGAVASLHARSSTDADSKTRHTIARV